jgi:hypothetical protein
MNVLDHEDYRDRRSPRERCADELLELLVAEQLAAPEQAPQRSPDGKFYEVLFRNVDPPSATGKTNETFGRVHVYNTGYLLVRYEAIENGEFRHVTALYGSVEEALAHILLAIRDRRPDLAREIPGRQRKQRKSSRS